MTPLIRPTRTGAGPSAAAATAPASGSANATRASARTTTRMKTILTPVRRERGRARRRGTSRRSAPLRTSYARAPPRGGARPPRRRAAARCREGRRRRHGCGSADPPPDCGTNPAVAPRPGGRRPRRRASDARRAARSAATPTRRRTRTGGCRRALDRSGGRASRAGARPRLAEPARPPGARADRGSLRGAVQCAARGTEGTLTPELALIFQIISTITVVIGFGFATYQTLNIRRQRRAEVALTLINNLWPPELVARTARRLFALPEDATAEQVDALDAEAEQALLVACITYEHLGYLVYQRIIPLRTVDEVVGGTARLAWQRLRKWVERVREESGPSSFEGFQWLYEQLEAHPVSKGAGAHVVHPDRPPQHPARDR